jgi:hypothetical protein
VCLMNKGAGTAYLCVPTEKKQACVGLIIELGCSHLHAVENARSVSLNVVTNRILVLQFTAYFQWH